MSELTLSEVDVSPATPRRRVRDGFASESLGQIGEEDLRLLRYMASVLDAGFPLVAFLQFVRVYGQAPARIADAQVKLFHLYVREPMMHDGVSTLDIAEAVEGLAADRLRSHPRSWTACAR